MGNPASTALASGARIMTRDTVSVRCRGRSRALAVSLAATLLLVSCGTAVAAADTRALDELETRLARDPSSLRAAAEYRQLVIEAGRYDRSITLFERLAKDPRGGANRFVNLALANVDKVPVSGSIRRALLGRDAL